ncbi:MAG: primosomal replication protein N [Oxalobacteraceae bacterium]
MNTERGENSFQCIATLAERDVVRYSPAGIPIVAAKLAHSSEQPEAGISRLVDFELAALAAGQVAGQLEQAELGARYRFHGFMARKSRKSKSIVFHLTDFETID